MRERLPPKLPRQTNYLQISPPNNCKNCLSNYNHFQTERLKVAASLLSMLARGFQRFEGRSFRPKSNRACLAPIMT